MKQAFTLIELLIVLAVLSLLAGMLMPMLAMAQRSARTTNTRAVLAATDAAVALFKAETRAWPWQAEDPALPGDADCAGRGNGLARRLGRNLDGSEAGQLRADLDAVRAAFVYNLADPVDPARPAAEQPQGHGAQAYRIADLMPEPIRWSVARTRWEVDPKACPGSSANNRTKWHASPMGACVQLNRMAEERARLAVLSGNVAGRGARGRRVHAPAPAAGAVPYPWMPSVQQGWVDGPDRSAMPLLATPRSQGWNDDYLRGSVPPERLRGDDVLDAWGNPLVYVCPVVPGVSGTNSWAFCTNGANWNLSELPYGLDPAGRVSERRWQVPAAFSGVPAQPGSDPEGDGVYTVDVGASDRRFLAAPGNEFAPELWSAGADGRWCGRRDMPANRDDVPLLRSYQP